MQTGGAPGATDNSSTSSPQYGGMPNQPSGTGQDIVDWLKSVVAAFDASAGTHLTVTADYRLLSSCAVETVNMGSRLRQGLGSRVRDQVKTNRRVSSKS